MDTKHKALTGVREDGTVEGYYIETYYVPCKGIVTDHELRVLKVIADDGATDTETRVLFDTLIASGWTPPAKAAQESRDLFEAVMPQAWPGSDLLCFPRRSDGTYFHDNTERAWVLWQAARRVPLPEGWQAVPVEATKAMCVAGVIRMFEDKQYSAPWEDVFFNCYRAMLKAAPPVDGKE